MHTAASSHIPLAAVLQTERAMSPIQARARSLNLASQSKEISDVMTEMQNQAQLREPPNLSPPSAYSLNQVSMGQSGVTEADGLGNQLGLELELQEWEQSGRVLQERLQEAVRDLQEIRLKSSNRATSPTDAYLKAPRATADRPRPLQEACFSHVAIQSTDEGDDLERILGASGLNRRAEHGVDLAKRAKHLLSPRVKHRSISPRGR